jgi:hypothetical protein
MADIEIRAFGLRLLGVLSKTQLLALIEKRQKPEEVGEPEFVSNTAGSYSIAEPVEAYYQDPYEQETDLRTELRFGFGG